MNNISKIEIQYFRSLYRVSLSKINDLNIFTGKNDAGKSNVLKALNLFFNNYIYEGLKFNFQENFNKLRAEEIKKNSIKGKQFIQIKITFNRGDKMYKSLPKQFTITKKWLRYDENPIVTHDLERQCNKDGIIYNDRTKMSLTKFLNSFSYIYIPAIKDITIFNKVLLKLQDTLYNDKLVGDKNLVELLNSLSQKIQASSKELNDEFYKATNIKANISSPKDITDFYSTLIVDTIFAENYSIKLDNRGDGIRVRYLPSILNYLALSSKKQLIWGFEEPENSVEYNLAIKMSEAFKEIYSKKSLIFLTSHSPSFINLKGENVQLFRCFSEENKTTIYLPEKALDKKDIAIELGYIHLQEELYNEYLHRKALLEKEQEEILLLQQKISEAEKPVLITEGKSDVIILKTAWKKLHPDQEIPFSICSCDIMPENGPNETSCAGCDMLKNYLTSYRYDSPHIVIGLFDRDDGGIRAYELSKNFIESTDSSYKKSKNNKAFALLLPNLESKSNFIKYKNFCIEFMFEQEYLDTKIDDKGLELEDGALVQSFKGVTVSKSNSSELYFKTVKTSTKVYFAEKIVPTFPKEAFESFNKLFEIILNILSID